METYTIKIGRNHFPAKYDYYALQDLESRVDTWCANYWKTCPTRYQSRWMRAGYNVTFYDKRMAMAFKLAWG